MIAIPDPLIELFGWKPIRARDHDNGGVIQEDPEEAFKQEITRMLEVIDKRSDQGLPVGDHIKALSDWVDEWRS